MAGLLAIAAITVALRAVQDQPNPTIAALLFLLVVLATATSAHLRVSIGISVAAMLAFNFFLLPPFHTLTIADPQNWVALFVFVVVAVIASQLSAAVRQRASEAEARKQEVTRLFDLSRDILLTTDSERAIADVARYVARRFELATIAICLPTAAGWDVHQGGERSVEPTREQLDHALARLRGPLEYDARQRAYGGHLVVGDHGTAATLVPLRLGTKPVGILATQGAQLDLGTLDALGGVVAIAIERAHFLAERKKAETAQSARRPRVGAPRVLQSRSPNPGHVRSCRRHESSGCRACARGTTDAGTAGASGTGSPHTPLPGHPRHGAHRRGGGESGPPVGLTRRRRRRRRRPRRARGCGAQRFRSTPMTGREIQVDPRLTSTALAHVLENAGRYSPKGATIVVRAWTESDGAHFMVRDHGPGLDPSDLDHLFEPFYRGPKTRHATGTGLGLAITRGLLAAEGGRIWCENVPGGGAQFTIMVPSPVRVLDAEAP